MRVGVATVDGDCFSYGSCGYIRVAPPLLPAAIHSLLPALTLAELALWIPADAHTSSPIQVHDPNTHLRTVNILHEHNSTREHPRVSPPASPRRRESADVHTNMSGPVPAMTSPPPRPSRFIEGEPLTHAPSATTQPLFNSIMTEEEAYSKRRRLSDPRSNSSSSSASSKSSSSETEQADPGRESLSRRSSSSLRGFGFVGAAKRSFEGKERKRSGSSGSANGQSTAERFKSRLRALTGGKTGDANADASASANANARLVVKGVS